MTELAVLQLTMQIQLRNDPKAHLELSVAALGSSDPRLLDPDYKGVAVLSQNTDTARMTAQLGKKEKRAE